MGISGGQWWLVVASGGQWWSVVVSGGQWWSVVVNDVDWIHPQLEVLLPFVARSILVLLRNRQPADEMTQCMPVMRRCE